MSESEIVNSFWETTCCVLSHFSCVPLFAMLRTVSHQAPLSMGFSRQEYWSGLSFPSPGDLPNPGIEPRSPTLQVDSLPFEPSLSVLSQMSYSCQLITHLECILYSLFTSFFSLLDLQSLDLAMKVAPFLTPFALALYCSRSVSQWDRWQWICLVLPLWSFKLSVLSTNTVNIKWGNDYKVLTILSEKD